MNEMNDNSTTNSIPQEAPARTSPDSAARNAAIEEFLDRFADVPDRDLLAEMIITVARLARDECGRGELKILNSALKELRYAFKVFAPYSDIRKVTIFGSARTGEQDPAYKAAVDFASRLSSKNWMVITGAGNGIMRAGHGGAGRKASFGVAIRLPFEQSANEIIARDPKLVTFKYFFTRKLMFVKEASAIALFPGGFGTQDECFESVTLVQTGKANPMPIVMVDPPGGRYWPHWREYVGEQLLKNKMINPEDFDLFKMTDDVDEAVQEVLHFYRVYHSSRYVQNLLAVRLNRPLSARLLDRLPIDFADLLSEGSFEQTSGPLEEENGEYPDLPRLVFAFNRLSPARLRHMIDVLNDDE
jgi:hypothetical protein